MRRLSWLFLSTLGIILVSTPSQAAWVLFDSFNTYAHHSEIDGQNGWEAVNNSPTTSFRRIENDPTLPGNLVFDYTGTSSGGVDGAPVYASRSLGSLKSEDTDTAHTLYTRFYVPAYTHGSGGTSGPDFGIALMHGPVYETGATGMGTHLRFLGDDTGVIRLQTRNPGDTAWFSLTDSLANEATLAEDTWYDLWLVTNNSTDSFNVYLQGGAGLFATQQQLQYTDGGVVTDIDFRDSRTYPTGLGTSDHSGAVGVDLDTIWFRHNAGHANDTIYFDHIVIDHDKNLTVPNIPLLVPEPSSILLVLGACLASGLFGIRRYRSL